MYIGKFYEFTHLISIVVLKLVISSIVTDQPLIKSIVEIAQCQSYKKGNNKQKELFLKNKLNIAEHCTKS